MCLIISHGKAPLSWLQFASVWKLNPDGYGAVKTDGTVFRTLDWLAAWSWYEKNSAHVAVSHWRMATHGVVSIENVHPFRARKYEVFHNGVLCGYGNDVVSDSRDFVTRHTHEIMQASERARTTAFVLFDRDEPSHWLIGDDWHPVGEYGEFSNHYAYDESEFIKAPIVCEDCGDETIDEAPKCVVCYFGRED